MFKHCQLAARAGWLGALMVVAAVDGRASRRRRAAGTWRWAAPRGSSRRPPAKTSTSAARVDGAYRLEVHATPVPPPLNDQLDLKGEGVVVEQVVPEGAAAKAGVQRHDIVLAVGDKPIHDPHELADEVNKSEGKEIAIKLLRAGKPLTVSVTPVKREGRSFRVASDVVEFKEVEKLIKEKLKQAGADVRMEFIQPGGVFSSGRLNLQRKFPDDLTVNVHKEGHRETYVAGSTCPKDSAGLNELHPHVAQACFSSP